VGRVLAVRVIPVMLIKGRLLVKGERFVNDRIVGHALQAAQIHAARGVDELMLIDVAATAERRGPDLDLIRELSRDVFVPLTVGGGVQTVWDVDNLLRAGADKVLIGAAARRNLTFIQRVSERFGSQAIVVAVDWPEETAFSAIAARMAGAGEILCNNAQRDGTMEGYDLNVIASVARQVDCPVIACGGCSGYEDMRRAIEAGASAVAAGALFQYTDCTPRGAAEYLSSHGIEARV